MSDVTLGKLITHDARKDAVHVAVAPCKANTKLIPGAHVGIHDGVSTTKDPIGIVDPFLDGPVKAGETFWLFLYPKTASNLRHEWDHPSFKEEADKVAAAIARLTGDESMIARNWLEQFAREAGTSYLDMMKSAAEYAMGDETDDLVIGTKKVDYSDDKTGFWAQFRKVTFIHPGDKECRGC